MESRLRQGTEAFPASDCPQDLDLIEEDNDGDNFTGLLVDGSRVALQEGNRLVVDATSRDRSDSWEYGPIEQALHRRDELTDGVRVGRIHTVHRTPQEFAGIPFLQIVVDAFAVRR